MYSGNNTPLTVLKALPPPAKDDDLPPPPPSSLRDIAPPPPPPLLPPKFTLDNLPDNSSDMFSGDSRHVPPLRQLQEEMQRGRKKVNPFVDLIETERIFVDTLSGIIRKVAAAWSRSNLPPPELDLMFRAVEAVFKANRSFQSKLKEIGTNPSSPRAIGDLLMKWIDQLDSPYTNYCSTYLSGFDTWELVQGNQRLPGVLDAFSTSNPPHQSGFQHWSLDILFSLPRIRIKYYQKLYGRLLKSSAPGKSTDKKLVEAVGKLERLLAIVEERSSIPLPGPLQVIESTDEVVIDTREIDKERQRQDQNEPPETSANGRILSKETIWHQEEQPIRTSVESSTRGSTLSSGQRSSRDTALTSEGRSSVSSLSMSMSDLERRLATSRCRDLFTMNPRSVRLSINSPNLPYTRELRLSGDTVVHFTPKSTNIGVIHRHGHIFLLTDLFLVCERMTPDDRINSDSEHADMWLCYPPLAAKHLRVFPLDDNSLEITVLKKEIMIFHFDSLARRDYVMREFNSTTSLAAALPPPSKQAPSPLPAMNNLSQPSAEADRYSNASATGSFSLIVNSLSRAPSPSSGDPSMQRIDPVRTLTNDTTSPILSPSSRSPSIREGGPFGLPPYSPSTELTAPSQILSSGLSVHRPSEPSSFGPDQVIPPPRGESSLPITSPPNSVGLTGYPLRPNINEGPPSFSPGQIIPQRGDTVRGPPLINAIPSRSAANPLPLIGMNTTMSPPPMSGMNTVPKNMMNPPHMHGMNVAAQAQQVGSIGMPPRSGSLGPRPPMSGPGHVPGHFPPGPDSIYAYYQQMPPHPRAPFSNPGRPSSDPAHQGGLRKSSSLYSLGSQYDPYQQPPRSAPPMPNMPNGMPSNRTHSHGGLEEGVSLRPMLPSAALPRIASAASALGLDDSPPPSPIEAVHSGPVETAILATMKCKVFLQQQHAQWKSLGSAKLTLYEQRPTMIKQLVVEADNKDNTVLISTIVLTDGVERVGKTGVAIELSDSGGAHGHCLYDTAQEREVCWRSIPKFTGRV
ncbi:hypothetical protein EW145_g1527 [Phellinidium pouzarii]|uniref:DH domain-containing protein n=1 Tax=Phellinidium pouzarii TaxID=167371 RepID=A0A4S4LE84_9AGAM|nr:hypothetical protein EW145_g1527 [Phellinidium pouzarii]